MTARGRNVVRIPKAKNPKDVRLKKADGDCTVHRTRSGVVQRVDLKRRQGLAVTVRNYGLRTTVRAPPKGRSEVGRVLSKHGGAVVCAKPKRSKPKASKPKGGKCGTCLSKRASAKTRAEADAKAKAIRARRRDDRVAVRRTNTIPRLRNTGLADRHPYIVCCEPRLR